jgi:putative DNA primase/helicase
MEEYNLEQTNWTTLLEFYKGSDFTPPANKPKKTEKSKPEITGPLHDGAMDTWDAVAIDFAMGTRHEVKYVPENDKWYIWNGYIWEADTKGKVRELVKDMGRSYKKNPVESVRKWGPQVLQPTGVYKVLEMCKTDPRMVVSTQEFDTEMYELNTPGGVVDLWTGNLTPPDSKKLVRRSTRVTPDFNMPTPKYDLFMSKTFAGQEELSKYVETLMGVTLVKSQQEQIFVYLFGEAGSGKGTFINLAQHILGNGDSGYVAAVDSSIFVESKGTPHPTEMMQFLGTRMAVSSEISQGQKMDTGKLKKTTGGDKITGRYMGKDFVTFDATHTLWLMANDKLKVPHDDKGVWRRLRTIPFIHGKKSSEFIQHLDLIMFEEEGPGILAKWILASKSALNEGFHTPESVVQANAEYIQDQDTMGQWIEYCIDTSDPSAFTSTLALRENYADWCKAEGQPVISATKFTQMMKAKEYTFDKKNNVKGFLGLKFNPEITLISTKYTL